MRWITYIILLFIAAALQSAQLGGFPHAKGDAWPQIQYLLILAIFYALYASENAGPLCGFACGVIFDLVSGEYVGLNAIPMALIAWAIVRIRLSVFREHAVSQVVIALLAVLLFALLSLITHTLTGSPMIGLSPWTFFGKYAGNAVYSAVVAPVLYWILFRFPTLLGFSTHGSRTRGHN